MWLSASSVVVMRWNVELRVWGSSSCFRQRRIRRHIWRENWRRRHHRRRLKRQIEATLTASVDAFVKTSVTRLVIFLLFGWLFGNILDLLWQIFSAIRQILIGVNGQLSKNNGHAVEHLWLYSVSLVSQNNLFLHLQALVWMTDLIKKKYTYGQIPNLSWSRNRKGCSIWSHVYQDSLTKNFCNFQSGI